MQDQHRNLKEKLISSKQESNKLREEVDSLSRLKDRVRTLELQLKVSPYTETVLLTIYPHFCLCVQTL